MSDDDNYKFGVDDVGENLGGEEDTSLDTSSASNGISATALTLLPVTIAGVFAFLQKATVVSALTSLFGGAAGFATAVATALWVVGAISVVGLGVLAFLVAVALLTGLFKRSAPQFILGLLGAIYFAVGYWGAVTYFAYLPTLVGFFIVSNLVIYGGVLVLGALVIAGALAVM